MANKEKINCFNNLVSKLGIDQKNVSYLTKKFIFFKQTREKKRSLFIVEKIKQRQRQMFNQTKNKCYDSRLRSKYGELFENIALLPAIDLVVILQDMIDDINNINDNSNHEILKRLKQDNALDTDGTIVSSFVQDQRQQCLNQIQDIVYGYYPFEVLDLKENKKDKRKVALLITQFITFTQATVDFGRFNRNLYYTWGEWYYHSYFTYNNFKSLVNGILTLERKNGRLKTSNLYALNYTRNILQLRIAKDNHNFLQNHATKTLK